MISGIESILIGSENAKKLADFYKNILGLKQTMEMEIGDNKEQGFAFELKAGNAFVILDHSEVKGKNKSPARYIINFEVDNIEKEVERLNKEKVKQVKGIYHVEDYGYIATFEDPDGNYFQLVKTRE